MEEKEGSKEEQPRPKPETVKDVVEKDVRELEELPPEDYAALEGAELKELIRLKRYYGRWVLRIMAVQLAFVNAVFVAYSWAGYDWKPPDRVVEVWLVATFVQIVGIVVGITRSLFPPGKDGDSS